MKITYRLTFDDYKEAINAHTTALLHPPAIPPGYHLPPNAIHIVGGPDPKAKPVTFSRSLLGWVLVLSVAVLVFVVFHEKAPSRPAPRRAAPASAPAGSFFLDTLVSFLPYILIFLVIWFFFLRQVRIQNKRAKRSQKDLDADPEFSQERTVEVHDWGVRISVPTHRHEFDWLAYRRVVETPNLFMLYQGDVDFQIVPKRAFAAPADVDAFRQLLETRVGDRRQSAFPVQVGPTGGAPGS